MSKISGNSIATYASYIIFFISPLSVCTINFGIISDYLLIFMLFLLLVCNKLFVFPTKQKYFRVILVCFYMPMVLSFMWAILKYPFVSDPSYNNYITSVLPSRLGHIAMFLLAFIGILNTKVTELKPGKLLQSYLYGVLIIFGLMGFWQILSALTGVWCPEIETRSNLYFASSLGISRVTSFADEPSFLVPFLIDACIISLCFKRYFFLAFFLVLIGFSLSFAGYLELILLFFVYLLFHNFKIFLKSLALVVVVAALLVLIFPQLADLFQALITSRAELQSDFSMDDTSRTLMLVQPVSILFSGDWISALVGYGPASLKYIFDSDRYDVIFATANNIYVDCLFENGIIGLVLLLFLYIYLWRRFSCIPRTDQNFQYILCGKLFVFHLLLSSFYRADYSSLRYVCLFLLIYCIVTLSRRNKLTMITS